MRANGFEVVTEKTEIYYNKNIYFDELGAFMDSNILVFLAAYKRLDELCKQILSSEKGITEYINQMDNQPYGKNVVRTWNSDYKQLKRMRYIRNQLVHEVNSFENQMFEESDIRWLEDYYERIIKQEDSFAILRKVYDKKITPANNKGKNKEEQSGFSFSEILVLLFFFVILLGIIYMTFSLS